MTVAINIVSGSGLDLTWATIYSLLANSQVQDGGTGSEFTLLNTGVLNGEDADIRFIMSGTGFTYSGTFPNISVTSGTITSITMQTEAGTTLATFSGFSISAAAFDAAIDTYISGGPGSPDASALDAIFRIEQYEATGGAGNDTIEGGNLADVLDGGLGADVFIGGAGNDTFIGGGAEGDTADYSKDALHGGNLGVRINQHGSVSQGGLAPDTGIDGFGDTDSIQNVLNIVGTQFDDEIYGGTHGNTIDGGAGSDFIFGHDGNDTLIGGEGGDTLDGGSGSDTADYRNATAGLTADLGNPANNTGEAINDSYTSIENLRGSDFNDHMRGNGGANTLIGGGGGDFLRGRSGADVLDGGSGNDWADYQGASTGVTVDLVNPENNTGDAAGDTFISIEHIRGSGNDDTLLGDDDLNVLRGGLGADTLDGRGGNDYVDYQNSTVGLTVSLVTPGSNTGEAAGDAFISIESLIGTEFADTLTGDSGNNRLGGGLGADTLDGGDGFDFAWYRRSDTGLTVSLANPGINTGEAAGDTFISIEGLRGSDFDDTLIGDSQNNLLAGGAGADSLDGDLGRDTADYFLHTAQTGVTASLANPSLNTGDAAGDTYTSIENLRGTRFDDTLIGDAANNFLRGMAGADALDGGGGNDWADYFGATLAVTVDLSNPGNNTNDAAGDTFSSIEHIRGSDNNDTLTGNAGSNFLRGGLGADALDGGAGSDTADYFGSTGGLTVDLGTPGNNTGEAIGDSYTSIEQLRGSAFDDTLRGDSNNNRLDGQGGADELDGGGGFDFAWYNTNSTGTGVTASLADSLVNTGDAAGDTYISIEGLIGTSMADTLIGDAANNFLRGQGGADTLQGGGGFDYADYFNATSGVTADLANPASNTGEAAGDTFTSIEGIRGSTFDDVLRGNGVLNGGTSVNYLIGGLGADTVDGDGGFDYADYRNSSIGLLVSLAAPGSNTGEAAGDIFISIEGLAGSGFADTLIGDDGNNNLVGNQGGDALDGQGGFDHAAYFNASSGLTVSLDDAGDNTGEAAGDTFISIEGLAGSSFDDTLIGDAGANSLIGGAGADVLDGGAGSDTARYLIWSAQAGVTASLADPGSNTGHAAGDTYISIENLWGTSFNDTLIGGGNDNVLMGDAGNDILIGGAGADTLDGGSGDLDRASYMTSASGLTVDLMTPASNTGDAAGDTYFNLRGLEGSNFDDDLRGDGINNFLIGGAGADILDGRDGFDFASYGTAAAAVTASLANPAINTGDAAGDTYTSIENLAGSSFDDTLIGDAGNSFLQGRGGADTLDGGGGFDYADYFNATSGVTVDLANPANNTGEAAGDTFVAIEGIRGSAFDDVLRGDDAINGGTAANILRGGLGADVLDGGAGFDFTEYVTSSIALTVSLSDPGLNTGEAAGDVFIAIEGIFGSNFDDVLIGDANSNRLSGMLGADVLDGMDGIDYAHYSRATEAVTVSLSDPGLNTGEAAGDTYISIESVTGSGFDDTLIGDDNDNFLAGGAGGDALDGGAGIDTADYTVWTAQDGITASLADSGVNTGDAAGDTYVSIENLRGTNFDDTLVGDAGDNALDGNGGTDTAGFSGDRADYLVTDNLNGTFSIADTRAGTPDGIDTVTNIELFQFADATYTIEELLGGENQAPTDIELDNATIEENATAGTLAGILSATDPDSGDTLTFSLLDDAGGLFEVFNGNEIVVASGAGLDYEAAPEHSVTVRVSDAGGLFYDEAFTIAVSDVNEEPTALTLTGDTVDENAAAGTAVGTLAATDPDIGDALTFVLTDDAGGLFELVGDEVRVAAGAELDFEAQSEQTIAVEVTDSGGLTRLETFTITIADVNEEPGSLFVFGSEVEENAPAGTWVATLDATDPDIGDTLTFSLADDAEGRFEIVGNELLVAPDANLDFEAAQSHDIVVEVTDSGGLTRAETVTITLFDVEEEPGEIILSGGEVAENAEPSTVVATLAAVDPEGSDITFSLADDAGGLFEIVGNEIRLAAGAVLDYETQTSYEVTVEATDIAGLTRTDTFSITVLDANEAPTDITVAGGTAEENAAAGTLVATLGAVDADAGETFTFAIANDPSGYFEIVGNEVRVAAGAALDYETQTEHTITIQVTDASGASYQEDVTITVLDANEAPTDITVAGGTVGENAAAGTLVATLGAVDADAGETFTFAIADDPSGYFEIVGNEVRVAAGAALDYETQTEHTITIQVTDASGASYQEDVTITVANVSPVIVGTSASETLIGTPEDDQIFGGGGNDTLSGAESNDQLFGEAGNDTLEGGAGTDTLVGGLHNDTYILNADDGDILIENAGEGTDTVRLGADYTGTSHTLLENFENLVILGTGNVAGFGNALDNAITGNSGSNIIDGGLGTDTMRGGGGDDVYYVDSTSDSVIEQSGGGTDEVRTGLATYSLSSLGNVENLTYIGSEGFTGTGNNAANILTGGAGDDTLDGAGGADTLIGGDGGDIYIVNHAVDVVVELAGQGIDTVQASRSYTLGADVENLVLTASGGYTATGNSLDNTITGNSGSNTLDGAGGADTLIGGTGRDTYIVDDAGDMVVELAGQGTDTVEALLSSFSLEALDNVEHLTFIGSGDFEGHGNALANNITGGAGNDTLAGGAGNDRLFGNDGSDSLDGGLGNDTMRGGIGDDVYHVDSTGDRATESSGQGTDTVISAVNFTLQANLENLELSGSAVNGTGNGLANTITGTALANTLNGRAGSDVLIGGGGLDTLLGGSGDDLLVFNGPAFARADGGTYQDTFVAGGDFDLDLTSISNSVLTGLEAFDITGGPGIDNLLRIGIDDVRDLSSSANAALADSDFSGPLSSNSIVVYGDAGDTVELAAGTGSLAGGTWQNAGVATIGGDAYDVYSYMIGSTLYGSIAIDTDMLVV